MNQVLLPFHVSGPFAKMAQFGIGNIFRKITDSAKGRWDAAQVRFKITEDEARMLLDNTNGYMARLDLKDEEGIIQHRLCKTVVKNATRALEIFEERKPKVAPFIVVPNSAEKLAHIQKMTNLTWTI